MTSSVQSVDVAVTAWHRAIEKFCRLQPSAYTKESPLGTRSILSGTPVSVLNGVFSTTRKPDLPEFSSLAASYDNEALPWSIQLRSAPINLRISQIAADRGLTASFTLPFMIKHLNADDGRASLPRNIIVRRVPAQDHDIYNTALASGFETPGEACRGFSAPPILRAEGMTAFLVEESGIPVATSFGIAVHGHVGVFNISTLPAYRRRGYARAATIAVLQHAYAQGVHTAFLHCTPAARGVYESLGFVTPEEWLVYATP